MVTSRSQDVKIPDLFYTGLGGSLKDKLVTRTTAKEKLLLCIGKYGISNSFKMFLFSFKSKISKVFHSTERREQLLVEVQDYQDFQYLDF